MIYLFFFQATRLIQGFLKLHERKSFSSGNSFTILLLSTSMLSIPLWFTDRTLPREDVVLNQTWSVGSTVSAGKQSAGQPILNISHGSTGPSAPRSDLQTNLVSSTLTTQLSSLNISSTAISRHEGQGVQTKAIAKQGHGSDTNTGVQDAVLDSLDQSQRRFVVNTEFNCAGEIATDRRQENAGSSGSDYEVIL